MKQKQYAIPEYVTALDLKNTRYNLDMTQKEFAKLVGVSKPTIERWEMGEGKITGPIAIFVKMMELHPEYLEEIIIPERTTDLRLYYMHRQKICTVIDVDDRNCRVKIHNYTNKLMFRAFGIVKNPTYDDYIEFLKSRSFPETREKMKLVLEELGLPFYDPFKIIEKTQGKMAEDDFWIRIER